MLGRIPGISRSGSLSELVGHQSSSVAPAALAAAATLIAGLPGLRLGRGGTTRLPWRSPGIAIGTITGRCGETRHTFSRKSGALSYTRTMALRAVRNRQQAAAVGPYVRPAAAVRPVSTQSSSKCADTATFPLQKKFGQHLLKNPGILDKLLAAANITSSDVVLEIGPG